MQQILNELNRIELVKQNNLKNYKIFPVDLKNNCSTQQIETNLNCLKLLLENVQLVANPRTKEYPIIKLNDQINVCFYICY
jgi:hypothetical protein